MSWLLRGIDIWPFCAEVDRMRDRGDSSIRKVETPTVLRNRTCLYCAKDVETGEATKEHLIARRFVPRGSLDGEWNLIARCCESCNREKADLEDELSAVSLLPAALTEYADPDLARESARKAAGSRSRSTGRSVARSRASVRAQAGAGSGLSVRLDLTGAPPIDDRRVGRLAMLHLRGIVYGLTYDEATREGSFWTGGFGCSSIALATDWGNRRQRCFLDLTGSFGTQAIATSAAGYFKAAIRKHPTEDVWSWGLEWNKNLRAVGFYGEIDRIHTWNDKLPRLRPDHVFRDGNDELEIRREIRLEPEHDSMFEWAS